VITGVRVAQPLTLEIADGWFRAATVRVTDQALTVTGSFAAKPPAELSPASAEATGRWLRERLDEAGITGSQALMLLGRSRLNARFVRIPPVPDHERPAVVRFAADGDPPLGNAVLDYSLLADPGAAPVEGEPTLAEPAAFAVWIDPAMLEAVRTMLKGAKLTPTAVVPSAYGVRKAVERSAALFGRHRVLIVDGSTQSMELTVWHEDRLGLFRTVPMPEADQLDRRLQGEVQRTLAAWQSECGELPVEAVVLAGFSPALESTLRMKLGLPVAVVHPTRDLGIEAGEKPFSLAVVGAASAGSGKWPINLLEPRKVTVQRNTKRSSMVLGGFLAASLLAGGAWYLRSQFVSKDQEIADLKDEIADFDGKIAALKKPVPLLERHSLVKQWLDEDIPWLDEANDFALGLPDTSRTYLESVDFSIGAGRTKPVITVTGRAKDAATVAEIQNRWAKDAGNHYAVTPRSQSPVKEDGSFPVRFTADVQVTELAAKDYETRRKDWRKSVDAALAANQQRETVPIGSTGGASASRSVVTAPAATSAPAAAPSASPAASPSTAPGPAATPSTTTAASEPAEEEDIVGKYAKPLKDLSYEEREKALNSPKIPGFVRNAVRERLRKMADEKR
jgi:Tfp pilus assembly PilM family ATPase